MKKSIEEKAKKLKTMFVTTNIFNSEQNDDKYKGCNYFILFHNTYKIVDGFKTQRELEERLNEILEEGVKQNAYIFF